MTCHANSLQDGFRAKTEKGASFDVDFSEGDWVDFDEKSNASVGIYNIETRIEKAK